MKAWVDFLSFGFVFYPVNFAKNTVYEYPVTKSVEVACIVIKLFDVVDEI